MCSQALLHSVHRRIGLMLSFNSVWALLQSRCITYWASTQKPHVFGAKTADARKELSLPILFL